MILYYIRLDSIWYTRYTKEGQNLSDKKKQVRRWVFPAGRKEKVLIATTSHPKRDTKLILKTLSNLHVHLTVSFKNDGAFDLHHTEEGKVKNHIPLAKGRVNLTKVHKAIEELLQDWRRKIENPIKITDQSLQDSIFLIPKSSDLLDQFYAKFYPIKGRKQVYPNSKTLKLMAKELHHFFHVGYADEIEKEGFPFALLVEEEGESVRFLLNDHGNCFVLDVEALARILPKAIEIQSRYCYRCGTEVPLTGGWCPTCKKRIAKMRSVR